MMQDFFFFFGKSTLRAQFKENNKGVWGRFCHKVSLQQGHIICNNVEPSQYCAIVVQIPGKFTSNIITKKKHMRWFEAFFNSGAVSSFVFGS